MLSRGRAKAVTAHERRSLLSDGSEEMPTSMLAGLKGLISFFLLTRGICGGTSLAHVSILPIGSTQTQAYK